MPVPMPVLIDLHRHLEGSIRPGTALEFAERDGHWLTAADDPGSELTATGAGSGLLPYLAKIETAVSTVRRADDWHRVAREAVTDAADDGLGHLELRFSPRFIEITTGLAGEAVIDAITDGVAAAGHERGLTTGLIAIVVRDLGPVAGAGQMDRILARRDRFVAVDLAGDEAGFPPALFAEPFRRARQAGLGVTIHAGEAAGPASVAAALDHLRPDRIGHGVRSAEDPRLMERLAREDVTLEVALTSNVDTGAAASLARHQIGTLLAAGVPVTLNTDNPTVSRTTLSRELAKAARAAGLTPDDCRAVADQAVRAAFRHP